MRDQNVPQDFCEGIQYASCGGEWWTLGKAKRIIYSDLIFQVAVNFMNDFSSKLTYGISHWQVV